MTYHLPKLNLHYIVLYTINDIIHYERFLNSHTDFIPNYTLNKVL